MPADRRLDVGVGAVDDAVRRLASFRICTGAIHVESVVTPQWSIQRGVIIAVFTLREKHADCALYNGLDVCLHAGRGTYGPDGFVQISATAESVTTIGLGGRRLRGWRVFAEVADYTLSVCWFRAELRDRIVAACHGLREAREAIAAAQSGPAALEEPPVSLEPELAARLSDTALATLLADRLRREGDADLAAVVERLRDRARGRR